MIQEFIIKKIFKIYPWIILSVVLILIFAHFMYSIFSPKFIGEKKEFYIEPGIKMRHLSNKLEKEEIIRSAFYFRILATLRKSNIKAGIYEFNGFYNLFDVLKILEKGGKGIKIIITEGMTLKEIEELLKNNNFRVDFSKYTLKDFPETNLKDYFPENVFLEGFLAPDTYEFFPSDDERKIIRIILNNFSRKYLSEILKNTQIKPYETLILASIVEKEAKYKEDFPVISGILIKRLENNWKLEVDATLVYEKCNYIFCQELLTKQDLRKDSPFNTYKNYGLPPQPISNPGILAIRAVVNPLMTDYWYYLNKDDGKAIFAKTLKEQQENIKKYLKK